MIIIHRILCGLALVAAPALSATPTDDLLASVTKHNDTMVCTLIANDNRGEVSGRSSAIALAYLAASYAANPRSAYHGNPQLLMAMDHYATMLEKRQGPEGYYDANNNLLPAPNSAFVISPACQAYKFLQAADSPDTLALRSRLERTIKLTGTALLTGGAHTPNHRWGICAGLARINELFPSPAYIARIDEWLDEGLDVDADGQWAERSPHYSAGIDNPCVLNLAVLLERPELLESVRRNLRATVYYMEPDGDIETVSSRKPDQRSNAHPVFDHPSIWEYYISYRYLAVLDQDPLFAAVSQRIEESFMAKLARSTQPMSLPLLNMLEWPEMTAPLPVISELPDNYAKVFPLSDLARIRRDHITATIFGGTDMKLGLGEGPGLSSNPTFFKFRKGRAVLESVRMTPGFFGTGFFYADGLTEDHGSYRLQQSLEVPYYLPLPKAARRSDGIYPLTKTPRFSGSMAYDQRDRHYIKLDSSVVITEQDGGFQLDFAVTGYDGLPVTIELIFRAGGRLEGEGLSSLAPPPASASRKETTLAELQASPTGMVLKDGMASYTVGNDRIDFGPGSFGKKPERMEGQSYKWMNGNLRIEGEHVYLTGTTPFHHTITIK